jgi:hypothetical protein
MSLCFVVVTATGITASCWHANPYSVCILLHAVATPAGLLHWSPLTAHTSRAATAGGSGCQLLQFRAPSGCQVMQQERQAMPPLVMQTADGCDQSVACHKKGVPHDGISEWPSALQEYVWVQSLLGATAAAWPLTATSKDAALQVSGSLGSQAASVQPCVAC